MRKLSQILFFLILFFSISASNINAQYGNYGCFSSGSTGGCRLGTQNCTGGGVIPNPSQCDGLPPGSCNSASFACEAPGACATLGQSCSSTTCCSGLNCVGNICATFVDAMSGVKSPPIAGCSGGQGFETAIGCIPVDSPQNFATWALRWGMGIAGGVALALIGYAGITIITSSGNPQKLQAGKELLTSAIAGLALLLFGVFLLRFIGIEILKIPGFG